MTVKEKLQKTKLVPWMTESRNHGVRKFFMACRVVHHGTHTGVACPCCGTELLTDAESSEYEYTTSPPKVKVRCGGGCKFMGAIRAW